MEELNIIIQVLADMKKNASYHNLSKKKIREIDAGIIAVEKFKKKARRTNFKELVIELAPLGTTIGKILLEIFKDSS